MNKFLRITLAGGIPYEKIELYTPVEQSSLGLPNIFEDSQIYFECKHGAYLVPDYNIRLIHVRNGKISIPTGSTLVKRLILFDDLNYQNCYIVHPSQYSTVGAPQVFKEFEQLVFICNDGLIISQDHQVEYVQYK